MPPTASQYQMQATPGDVAEEEWLNLFPLLAVASWNKQMASLVLCYSKDQCQGLGALRASNTLLGWEEMQGCGGGTWAPPPAPFPISQTCAGVLHRFDHDGAKLLGSEGEDSIPGWGGKGAPSTSQGLAAATSISLGLLLCCCTSPFVFKGSQIKFSRFPPALVPAASNILPVCAFQLPLLVKLLFWSCFPSAS